MRSPPRRRNRPGATLIEAMIVVVIIGVAALWLSASRIHSPGTPGGQALRVERATELLVKLQQEALATPFDELEREAQGEPGPRGRKVELVGPGLLRVTLEASWAKVGAPESERRSLKLVTLRGEGR